MRQSPEAGFGIQYCMMSKRQEWQKKKKKKEREREAGDRARSPG